MFGFLAGISLSSLQRSARFSHLLLPRHERYSYSLQADDGPTAQGAPGMTRLTSLNPWLAAVAVALCVQLPAQAQERFTLSIPGVSDNRLFTAAAASDAAG
jgi:hypothetical protein